MSVTKPQSPTLIDTISAGYQALNRRLWVIGIPAGISAYLWFGTPLTLAPYGSSLADHVNRLVQQLSDNQHIQAELLRSMVSIDGRLAMAWINFVPVLNPELRGTTGIRPVAINNLLELFAATVLINLLALVLSSLFLTLLCGAVRNERFELVSSLRHSIYVARTIVLSLLAMAGVVLILAMPFLAISALVIAALPNAALIVLLAWYIVLFWGYVYTGFAAEAILISRAGPLRALYNSVNVVRRNLTGTIGLLLLSFVIISGLGIVWHTLTKTMAGQALAILGSAYVSSGLSAARLEFYRERMTRWRGRA